MDLAGLLLSGARVSRLPASQMIVVRAERHADRLDMPRIRFQFAKHKYGDLRAMIDVLNSFAAFPGHAGRA